MADWDIFISYKNDGEGNNFASVLHKDLGRLGFNVYYNEREQHAGSFPDNLRNAIEGCKDFLLVLTQGCLDQLINNEKVDWVREEILIAYNNNKNIIPLLMPGVSMPKDRDDMPECLRFLPDKNAINITHSYDRSPLDFLLSWIKAKPVKNDIYRNVYESNPDLKVQDYLAYLLEGAKKGDYNSMFELATFYMYHEGYCNVKNAAYWYKKVLESDDETLRANALSRLGTFYFSGAMPGEKQSFEKAFELREQAAKTNPNAAMQNAAMRRLGSGVKFVYSEVEEAFDKLDKKDSISIKEQAEFYLSYGRFEKAIGLFKQIQDIMPAAAYQLGLLYKLGVHTDPPEPDCFRAENCFRRASKKGHVMASYELGMLYYNPPLSDFKKDFEQAVEYFKLAADSGISEAQYKLGWMYRFGLGCEINIEESIKYQEMAALKGHTAACGQLAYLYQIDGFINYQRAFKYAKLSADAGYGHGAYMCANFLFWGRGCVQDEEEALRYYSYAYEHGSLEAKIMLDYIENRK